MAAGSRQTLLAFLAGLSLAASVAARPRIDQIFLQKGDRVTGEIVRLEAAYLSVRTLAFGTVEVDWPDVVGLVSPQLFEVERADGARFAGSLEGSGQEGILRVVSDGREPVEIAFSQVVGIDQRGSNLWASRRGYIDLGSTFSQADSDSTFTLEAELALKGSRFRWVNSLTATITDDTGDEQRQREILQSVLEIPLGRRYLLIGMAQHERNDDLDLQARDMAGGVVAWLPVNGARGRIVLGPGATESREAYFSRDDTSSVTSGVVLLGGEYHRFGRFGTRASLSILWFPVLTGPSRDRVEVKAGLRQKLGSNFTLTVSPYYSFDSLSPSTGESTEDWGWTTTVGWLF